MTQARDPPCRILALAYFFYWLGLSIGMHAFPSTTDLSHLWSAAPGLAKKGNLLAILSLPLAGLLVVLNYARASSGPTLPMESP